MADAPGIHGSTMTQSDLVQLFQPHAHDLERFLTRRLGCPQTAADLLQETLLRLVQLGAPQSIDNPRAFLFRVAGNLVIDHQRRQQRETVHRGEETAAAEIPDPCPSIETVLFSRQPVEVLKQAIAELPPKCRQVFILHKFKHLSYAEVGARLGIAQSTVVKHMIKALEYCKRRIDEETR